MYANVEVDEHNHTVSWPAMLLNDLVDGIIVVGAFLEEAIADISRRTGKNIILVDAYTSDDTMFDTVVMDNFGGAIKAVAHLVEHKHRHIGLILQSEFLSGDFGTASGLRTGTARHQRQLCRRWAADARGRV
ncbi:MAG: hypothetical protein U0694_03400 [Anaerolineae bacterium]